MTEKYQAAWLPALLLVAVAMATTVSGLGNGFALDDVSVIVQNTDLHAPETAMARAFEPYLANQLLRPLPQLLFAVQWWIGAGNPLIFHLVNILLYALVCVLVYSLCVRVGASRAGALLGALVFAVHPVHSEVTANVVGQLELLTTGFVLTAALLYLRAREGGGWRRRDIVGIAICFALATHTKEAGYVLPFLLITLELLVVRDPAPWVTRRAVLREPLLILVAVLFGSLAVRNHFLGSLGGGSPHLSLDGMGLVGRVKAVLIFIPEWVRLLAWPARLQVEYGPPALDPRSGFGAAHALGLLQLTVVVGIVVRYWRRHPHVALGIGWIVIGLGPVANLAFPTGVLVAERTLFLPSVGFAVFIAAVGDLWRRYLETHSRLRWPILGGVAVVLALAGWRSAARQPDWRDTLTLLQRDELTARNTYRVHLLLGQESWSRGRLAEAEQAYRRAGEMWPFDPRPFHDLGQILRARGACAEAIPILARGVQADSLNNIARSRLIECLVVERRWDEADREIGRGLAQGVTAYRSALARVEAGRLADALR